MLVVWFITPPSNPKEPEIFHDLMAMLILGMVAKESKWGFPFINKVLEAINELVEFCNQGDLEDVGFATKENLSISETTIDGGIITRDLVG